MRPASRRLSRLPAGWSAATTVFAVLLVTAGRYELHGDELYFRLLPVWWWYDDQPPLTVWLTELAALLGDSPRWQRLPATLAAAGGAVAAAALPRVLGGDRRTQEIAAWAHATTVYPLIVGHVFLTSSLDLLFWQLVVLAVVRAALGRPAALVWAGVIAGIACWNKLLVLPLVGALTVSLLLTRRDLVFSRHFALGALAAVVIGGPQVAAQAWQGWPMSSVSGDLIAVHGRDNRLLVLPLLVAFVGPPLVLVCLRGLQWHPPRVADGPDAGSRADLPFPARDGIGLLMPAAVLLIGWNLLAPAQPYYAIGLLLPAASIGWVATRRAGGRLWRDAPRIVGVNALVASAVALPLIPVSSPAYDATSAINPVSRDQVGWRAYVSQVDEARRGAPVVADSYALAGALAHYGDGIPVASGHNALWRLGPPAGEEVLLVGHRAEFEARLFATCHRVGSLQRAVSDPFGVAGSAMFRCRAPIGGWQRAWPALRHLGA